MGLRLSFLFLNIVTREIKLMHVYALSSFEGVYSKLQNVSVPLDEKLILARYVWDSPDCVIPNKQQVLLDWIVQGLLNRSKKDPQNV